MDALPQLGRGLLEVLDATFAAYEPLLLPRESEIKSTRRETHQYGTDPRQALDVYYPDEAAAARAQAHFPAARPVLVFLYGGGFFSGDRLKADYAHDAVFANIGHYFAARHGFTVVVPDYRLLLAHGARFPSGGEDVALAVDWIARSLTRQNGYAAIDLFVMGNSAGGVHAATWALHPAFADSVSRVTSEASRRGGGGGGPAVWLRALMLLGVPAHFNGEDNEILRGYFGDGADDIAKNAPLGLLKAATQQWVGGASSGAGLVPGVKVAALLSELDPEYIYQSVGEFAEAWPGPGAVETHILRGHNHISPQVSLGTGIEREEAWGVQVADICRSAASS
ncbi:hypothetical protein SLS62_005399 [Diatrype stigma]|uniref:BD-FAE-like domain-containing protein n=1 Tax=Diatrype stigma TaxID=117547 RepID=A0AAN9YSV6_9PEZI